MSFLKDVTVPRSYDLQDVRREFSMDCQLTRFYATICDLTLYAGYGG